MNRVAGPDALRFIAAFWVLVGHAGALPFIERVDRSDWLTWALVGVYKSLFSGPAAVIIFFVISGFCIHYPFVRGERFEIGPFYLRRATRIVLPMAVAMALAALAGIEYGLFELSILWSLFAELIYYALYPVLRRLFAEFGLDGVLIAAFGCALAVVMTDPTAGNYPSYGWQLNWLLGLPCWVLGVKLAERWARRDLALPAVSTGYIWRWRLGVWALSAVCLVLRFHSPVGYPWSLNLFAIVAYFWIDLEIARAMSAKPWQWLEWMGGFSYSIYLFHVLGLKFGAEFEALGLGSNVAHVAKVAFAIAFSYVMYLLIEKPAHRLARRVSHAYASRTIGSA